MYHFLIFTDKSNPEHFDAIVEYAHTVLVWSLKKWKIEISVITRINISLFLQVEAVRFFMF